MNMLQVAVLGVAGVLLAVQFKGEKTEYSTYIALGVSVLIFTAVLGQLEVLVDTVRESICKDAGYQTVAAQIEIFGKLLIMVLSVPILLMVLQAIGEFLT